MPNPTYTHRHKSGSHYDVLKNVVYIQTVKLLQDKYPDGIALVDTHSGPGVYDETPEEFYKGANRCVEKNLNAPAAVKKYVSLLNKLRTEFGEATLPGSALFARELMRDVDEHRLVDLHHEDVEGLFEDAQFQQMDAYEPRTLDFLVPYTSSLHPVVLIDPPYDDPNDWFKARELFDRILERNSEATIVMWMPFIKDDRHRWSYPKCKSPGR
jgi:23S rRNA (adenine2030-N6)-methyltransferase